MSRTITGRLSEALPFWISLLLVPLPVIAGIWGGWTLWLTPVLAWWLVGLLDGTAVSIDNADTETPVERLFWYRLITWIWPPVQLALIFGLIGWLAHGSDLSPAMQWAVMIDLGIVSGTVGIVYAHELLHQPGRGERWLGDVLLASVLYSHFRTEHLLVHHVYVGTPRDAVTARYNEGFWRFFLRVLRDCPRSAWRAEIALLARANMGAFSLRNPFWRYAFLQIAMLALAFAAGGIWGLFLFATQAFWAVLALELANYIEHYGLTRRHLGDGKYEPVRPHHSWNASHRVSNWLLINLQRHSDHHTRPDRRFPLLQTYDAATAPQLRFGYTLTGMVALVPPLWRRMMNARVRDWRRRHYPDIEDWSAYKAGTTPMPR